MSQTTNTYDTTNLDSQQWAQMASLVGSDMRSGQTFNVTGPNAQAMINAASAASGVIDPSTGTNPIIKMPLVGASPVGGNAAAPGAPSDSPYDFYGGTTSGNDYNPITHGTSGNPSDVGPDPQTPDSVLGFVQSHMANYGLVILGALLVLGALLISQRKTIETVATTAAKVAA